MSFIHVHSRMGYSVMLQAMSDMNAKKKGPLRRISATEIDLLEARLSAISSVATPDNQTKRQAFRKLMPHLRVMRERGCSWTQLATELAAFGVTLQVSTIRSYYGAMSKENGSE